MLTFRLGYSRAMGIHPAMHACRHSLISACHAINIYSLEQRFESKKVSPVGGSSKGSVFNHMGCPPVRCLRMFRLRQVRFQLDGRLGEAALNAGAKELQMQRTELFQAQRRGGFASFSQVKSIGGTKNRSSR